MSVSAPKRVKRTSDALGRVSEIQKSTLSRTSELNEMLSRSTVDLDYLIKVINNSEDIVDVYEQFDGDKQLLIAAGVLDEDEFRLLKFLDEHDLTNEIYKSYPDPVQQRLVNFYKDNYDKYIDNHKNLLDGMGANHDYIRLPDLFVVGLKHDFELIDMLSLNANVYPLLEKSDIDKLVASDDKILISFDNISKHIFSEFRDYALNNEVMTVKVNNITPFNRKNLEKEILKVWQKNKTK